MASTSFCELTLDDPFSHALETGELWGDIMLSTTPSETASSVSMSVSEEGDESHEEYESDEGQEDYESDISPVEIIDNGYTALVAKNLPRGINVSELRNVFGEFGTLTDVYIPMNMDKSSPYYGSIRGFARVVFAKSISCATAHAHLDDVLVIRNKRIVLEFANGKQKTPEQMRGGGGCSRK
jgi:RNA recognition motif-containing protein